MICSLRAYLSRNRHKITWVSNYRYPIWTFRNQTVNQTPVIGYPRDSHVNYARFSGFLRTISYSFHSFEKLQKSITDFLTENKFSKDILNSDVCYRHDELVIHRKEMMATGTFTYNTLCTKTLKERIKTQKYCKSFKLDKSNVVSDWH